MAEIDPFQVRFSQASVKPQFRDGSSIAELADALRDGKIQPSDIPPIRLVKRDGLLYTIDNRRLLAFQLAKKPVPYQMATDDEIEEAIWKFTTTNQGVSIQVRGMLR